LSVWTSGAPLSIGRAQHTATLLPNGKVLIAGGMLANETPVADADIYDPVADTCTSTGTMNNARYRHTATLLPNGMVLVVGGWSNAPLGSVELFNPDSGAWTRAASPGQARVNHTATLLPNGNVLIAGGASRTASLSSVQLYDPTLDTWTTAGFLTTARSYHTATLLPDGTVLVAGGYFSTGGCVYPVAAELWQTASGAWAPAGNMARGREWHTAVLLADGKVLLAGGYNSYSRPQTLSTAELYVDPAFGPKITLTGAATLPGGALQFAFTNTPGSLNTVLVATNLASTLSTWTAAGTATEVSPGQFVFTDLQATNFLQRSYCVRTPY
jgi:WD40 repeat protein